MSVMESAPDVRVVLCTAPADRAEEIARALLEARLAACVNVVPGLASLYWWKGEICRDGESLLVIKTREGLLARLEGKLAEVHPYDTPEVLALPVVEGAGRYLAWLRGEAPG